MNRQAKLQDSHSTSVERAQITLVSYVHIAIGCTGSTNCKWETPKDKESYARFSHVTVLQLTCAASQCLKLLGLKNLHAGARIQLRV